MTIDDGRSPIDDRPFTPLPRWKGGHWMTLYAWGKSRTFPALPPAQPRVFDVAPGTRVLAHCHWQPRPWEHPTLIALHGLESSSEAHYVRGLADKAFAGGFNAVASTSATAARPSICRTASITRDSRAIRLPSCASSSTWTDSRPSQSPAIPSAEILR